MRFPATESSMTEDLSEATFPPGEPPYAGANGAMVQIGQKMRFPATESSMTEDLSEATFPPGEPPYAGANGAMVQIG